MIQHSTFNIALVHIMEFHIGVFGTHMEELLPVEKKAPADYLAAKEVIGILNIKPQTLYAYVTRGWLRAIPQPGTHTKLYLRDDVERLRSRSQARAGHGPLAAAALRWGDPVITTAITEITPLGPRYRGMLATDLARKECAFEATADFLWSGCWDERTTFWSKQALPADFGKFVKHYFKDVAPKVVRGKLAMLVQLLSDTQGGHPEVALDRTSPAVRQIIHVVAGAFGMLSGANFIEPAATESVTDILIRAMRLTATKDTQRGLNAALTLAADHELALPSFTARVVASSGASLNASLLSGMMAFEGPLTGIGMSGIEDLVIECKTKAALKEHVLRAHRQGRQLPGFHHPLYPHGDPRARYLIEFARSMKRLPAPAHALLEALTELDQEFNIVPGFPAGLVVLQLALELPPRSAGALFLLGRIAGLAAHIQEQRLSGFFIRPRAKFVL